LHDEGDVGQATRTGKLHRRRLRRTQRLFSFDRSLGARWVAGTDEAGRGSLAGPLVAAGVLFDYDTLSLSDRRALAGLHDSKQMDAEARERLYPCVLRAAARVAVTIRCVRGIDSRGLHVTNIEALSTSLRRVANEEAICLVDGFRLPPCPLQHRAVIGGDATSAAIAAASVIAKVTRDRCMHRAHGAYPDWGFDVNVGYSTPEHRAAILANGISTHHRRSFQSVAYSQLALGESEQPAELLEGGADVIELDQHAARAEADADHIEAQLGETRDAAAG
jgi:ribonuclease HII